MAKIRSTGMYSHPRSFSIVKTLFDLRNRWNKFCSNFLNRKKKFNYVSNLYCREANFEQDTCSVNFRESKQNWSKSFLILEVLLKKKQPLSVFLKNPAIVPKIDSITAVFCHFFEVLKLNVSAEHLSILIFVNHKRLCNPSTILLVQSKQWKHQSNMSLTSVWSFIINFG